MFMYTIHFVVLVSYTLIFDTLRISGLNHIGRGGGGWVGVYLQLSPQSNPEAFVSNNHNHQLLTGLEGAFYCTLKNYILLKKDQNRVKIEIS